jgi:hypothetical protein
VHWLPSPLLCYNDHRCSADCWSVRACKSGVFLVVRDYLRTRAQVSEDLLSCSWWPPIQHQQTSSTRILMLFLSPSLPASQYPQSTSSSLIGEGASGSVSWPGLTHTCCCRSRETLMCIITSSVSITCPLEEWHGNSVCELSETNVPALKLIASRFITQLRREKCTCPDFCFCCSPSPSYS